MDISLVTLGNFLERQKLVGIHDSVSPKINNLSYEEIKKCCSLSQENCISRFVHRLFAFLKTGYWMNDRQIGIHLFYEFLWVTSAMVHDIQHQNDSRKAVLLAQIHLIDKIFDQIILAHYREGKKSKFPHSFIPIPLDNQANPKISHMFPIKINSDVGVTVAKTLSWRIKALSEMCQEDHLYQVALQRFQLLPAIGCVHHPKRNKTIQACCWSQAVLHPLSLFSIEHKATCITTYDKYGEQIGEKTIDSQVNDWWDEKQDEEKIAILSTQKIRLEKINQIYFSKERLMPPYRIQFELSSPSI